MGGYAEAWNQVNWAVKVVWFLGLMACVFLVIRSVAATVYLVSQSHLGRNIGIRESYSQVPRKNPGILWLLFLLPIFFGPAAPLALAITTFFLGPSVPVTVLENRKPGEIFQGWSLSEGRKVRLVVIWCAFSALLFIAFVSYGLFVFFIYSVIPYHPIRNIIFTFAGIMLVVMIVQLWITALTSHYYECTAPPSDPGVN
jgi:hypothetical protein